MNRRNFLQASAIMGVSLALGQTVQAVEKISADPAATELCTSLLSALAKEDPKERLAAVMPLVHRSLLNNRGNDLDHNVKEFSYRKASGAAKLYQNPAQIVEVHKGNVTTIGFKETAERGRTDKYFVGKKEGVAGRPAPLHVFWPEKGGAPKIVNMGSL